jgi:4,5-DOPA dioxygenase extradiol
VISRRAFLGATLSTATLLRSGKAAAEAGVAPAAIFVSHGSPLYLPIPGNDARREELRLWGSKLPKPKGIVVMTPHFAARRLELGVTGRGFAMFNLPGPMKRQLPQHLDYATPPSQALGMRVARLLGQDLPQPQRRGFDHTTWMPLRCLWPDADVPVVELGYPYAPEAEAFALGQKLAPLRAEGVLFLASGGMTHNLATDMGPGAPIPAFSREFDGWASERLIKDDVDALVDWRKKAPAPYLAHPDDGGHYRVLLVALGFALAGKASSPVSFPISGFEGALSKRCAELA